MRGNLWALAVVAVFAGLLVRAVNAADQAAGNAPANSTTAVSDVLGVLDPIVGLTLFLVAIGTAVALSFGRGF